MSSANGGHFVSPQCSIDDFRLHQIKARHFNNDRNLLLINSI